MATTHLIIFFFSPNKILFHCFQTRIRFCCCCFCATHPFVDEQRNNCAKHRLQTLWPEEFNGNEWRKKLRSLKWVRALLYWALRYPAIHKSSHTHYPNSHGAIEMYNIQCSAIWIIGNVMLGFKQPKPKIKLVFSALVCGSHCRKTITNTGRLPSIVKIAKPYTLLLYCRVERVSMPWCRYICCVEVDFDMVTEIHVASQVDRKSKSKKKKHSITCKQTNFIHIGIGWEWGSTETHSSTIPIHR